MSTAFLFPGQGAQYSGMGRALYEASEKVQQLYRQAEMSMPGITALCFEGEEAALKDTRNAQPAIFLTEMTLLQALSDKGIRADCLAGFSLGELSAVCAAGLLPFAEAFALVQKRGELMAKAAEEAPAFMAAVLRLDQEKVEEICRTFQAVYPVNYNCPGQISVSGSKAEEEAFCEKVKEARGRAIPLKVSGGFHSPFMQGASEAFGEVLQGTGFGTAKLPLYSNITGDLYEGNPAALLAKQISSPVQWEKTIRNMLASGVDHFIEVGPGKTLSGMVQKIDGTAAVQHAETLLEIQ